MKSVEEFVTPESDYYIHAPSRQALELFLYPLQCGRFTYLPGYSLARESFDSFLLMYIEKGRLTLTLEGKTRHVSAGSFVLLDCYKLHAYSTDSGWTCVWCHFDGAAARSLYSAVVSRLGCVFTLPDGRNAFRKLGMILDVFQRGKPVQEPLMHKYLTDILTEFLLAGPSARGEADDALMAEEITAYIAGHFAEDLPLEKLAARAGLSLYHFIRVFKRETGFTPHEYIVNTRITTAKYLLKNSSRTVKEICRSTGFSSESVFCSAFKRSQGVTPGQYRNQT